MIKNNEIFVGPSENFNGLGLYRVFNTFVPTVDLDVNANIIGGTIRVYYWEYLKTKDGKVSADNKKYKNYLVQDIPEVEAILDENNNVVVEARPAFSPFSNWLNQIARTPVNPNTVGILDAIEYTLQNLPMEVPDGYVLKEA